MDPLVAALSTIGAALAVLSTTLLRLNRRQQRNGNHQTTELRLLNEILLELKEARISRAYIQKELTATLAAINTTLAVLVDRRSQGGGD